MGQIQTYKDLIVWQKSISFVTEIYNTTKQFPNDELYGLVQQIRRCSVSIPSNVAEGFGRNSQKDFKRFLNIAMGSLFELQTQIEISLKLGYVTDSNYSDLYEKSREIERLLSGLIKSIDNK